MSFGKVDFTEYLSLPLLLFVFLFGTVTWWDNGAVAKDYLLSSNAAKRSTVCIIFFVVHTDKTNNCPAEHILFIPRLVFSAIDYAVVHMEC